MKRYININKKHNIEVVKSEPLPHLWTHLLATTDAVLYVIHEERDTQANIKDITELMLDGRTNSMPIVILINNNDKESDNGHITELESFLGQYQEQKQFPITIKAISGTKRELKLQSIIEVVEGYIEGILKVITPANVNFLLVRSLYYISITSYR